MDRFVGDALDVLLAIAVGGMLWAAIGQLRRHRVEVPRCPKCGRATSRAYPRCPACGEATPTLGS